MLLQTILEWSYMSRCRLASSMIDWLCLTVLMCWNSILCMVVGVVKEMIMIILVLLESVYIKGLVGNVSSLLYHYLHNCFLIGCPKNVQKLDTVQTPTILALHIMHRSKNTPLFSMAMVMLLMVNARHCLNRFMEVR